MVEPFLSYGCVTHQIKPPISSFSVVLHGVMDYLHSRKQIPTTLSTSNCQLVCRSRLRFTKSGLSFNNTETRLSQFLFKTLKSETLLEEKTVIGALGKSQRCCNSL